MKKDIFSKSKRLADIARQLRHSFELWNYTEVFLPAVEDYSDSLRKGLKLVRGNKFYSVKPDITSQIVENRLDTKKMRLYYITEVLNNIEGEWQAGIEYIGGDKQAMQVEGLHVAISSLTSLGINDFYIDIGSLHIWREKIKSIRKYENEIFEALHKRNFGIIEELPISRNKKEELWKLFNFRDQESNIAYMNTILDIIDDDRVFIDFGTVRPLPYYADFIFEIYSPKLGHPIGGGGDYKIDGGDGFGFAFKLNALMELYDEKIGMLERKKIRGDLKSAYTKAKEAVDTGTPVEVCI